MTDASKEFIWIKNIVDECKRFNLNLGDSTMFCDNQAAISFTNSSIENIRTKHIDVRYHFIRRLIYDRVFKIKYVQSKKNLADIFTKPLNHDQLSVFCRSIFQVA